MAQLETRFEHAFDMPYRANATVRGGRLVHITAPSDSAAPKPRVEETASDAGTDLTVGAALADKAVDEDVTVVRRGVQKLTAAAAVVLDEYVYPASAGRVRGAANVGATALAAGARPYGIALGAAAADGQVWVKVL